MKNRSKQVKLVLARQTVALLSAKEIEAAAGGLARPEYTYALKCTSYCNGHCF